jgi:uncharacterized protein (DUF2147 family)
MKKTAIFLFLLMALGAWPFTGLYAQTHKSDDIAGIWLNQEGTAKISVFKVGSSFYGKIVWLKVPNDSITGKPRTDVENPDPKLKAVPLLGLVNLKGFEFDGKDEWKDGTIYDPKNGKTYSCYIKFGTPESLKIRGYIGISLLGRTTLWTKSQ